MTRTFCLALPVAAIALSLSACTPLGQPPSYPTYFDAQFEHKGDPGVFKLTSSVVSDINSYYYRFESKLFYTNAGLDAEGKLVKNGPGVLSIAFNDEGDGNLTRQDDKAITLRLQIESDGTVSSAVLGNPGGTISVGLTTYQNPKFVSGKAWILYRGDEMVIGQIHAIFEGYEITGSFRASSRRI